MPELYTANSRFTTNDFYIGIIGKIKKSDLCIEAANDIQSKLKRVSYSNIQGGIRSFFVNVYEGWFRALQ